MWTCRNCGRSANVPESAKTIRCQCGLVSSGASDRFEALVSSTGSHSWLKSLRQDVCLKCEFKRGERCVKIDLGCRNAYLREIESREGKCPEGKWASVSRVRFVTVADLTRGAMALAEQVPLSVTSIIGVPRSGMIAASIVATKLNLPLFTLSRGEPVFCHGGTRANTEPDSGVALIVDDTVHSGIVIGRAIEDVSKTRECLSAVVFTTHTSKTDFYQEILPTPHLLEWHLFNSPFMESAAIDMDGVICHNPPNGNIPLYVPRRNAALAIVTARMESERDATEEWLAKHGVQYKTLRMWPGTDAERKDWDAMAAWKAREVRTCGASFYIESEPGLSNLMRKFGTQVLCPAQGYLE